MSRVKPSLRHLLLVVMIALVASVRWQHALAESAGGDGNQQRLSIAVPDDASASDGVSWPDIAHEIASDLEASGQFRLVKPAVPIESRIDIVPPFDQWRGANAQWLVIGRVQKRSSGLFAEFRLWNVVDGKQVLGQQYKIKPEDSPRVTRLIADAIIERLTGEQGRRERTEDRK
jgi:TolB protein